MLGRLMLGRLMLGRLMLGRLMLGRLMLGRLMLGRLFGRSWNGKAPTLEGSKLDSKPPPAADERAN
jgi:hypothetical protein